MIVCTRVYTRINGRRSHVALTHVRLKKPKGDDSVLWQRTGGVAWKFERFWFEAYSRSPLERQFSTKIPQQNLDLFSRKQCRKIGELLHYEMYICTAEA